MRGRLCENPAAASRRPPLGRCSGRRNQCRVSHPIENELRGEPREQHAGYPADNVGACLSQTAHQAFRREHLDKGDTQADRDHQHDRSSFQPGLCAAHDQYAAGASDQRKRHGKYRDVAGLLRISCFAC